MRAKIRDPGLYRRGMDQIEWAEKHMPVLMKIRRRFSSEKTLSGVRIGAVLHVTKETAVLLRTLIAGGAEVWAAGSNPLSTQDDVAAALASEGVNICAWRGQSSEDYWACIDFVAESNPSIILDDGADLHGRLHSKYRDIGSRILGGTEETTTGVIRLKAMERDRVLLYPVIAVNNAQTKYLFDNRYGTGQSTVDGLLRATNILIAGKTAVVAGYGWVGKGIAMRLRGMGARVVVVEVDPIKALEAYMDGYMVTSMSKAAEIGDIFITATGNKDVIRREHMLRMKDGAILANAGHFNVEISIRDLEDISIEKRVIRENLTEYKLRDGRRIYLLAEGRLVNLVAAEGHPSEVMDMSFANQALSVEYIYRNSEKLEKRVYNVPEDIDRLVAELKLEALGVEIERLTEEQIRYLSQWTEGT